jgi:Ca-activated chloride channel family protein
MLWARAKVAFLQEESWIGMMPDAAARITELGLEHSLVTPYTSFVAVDETRSLGRGDPRTIAQPVDVPEGVDGVAAGVRPRAEVRSLTTPDSVAQPGPASGGYDYELDEEAAPMAEAPAPPAAERGARGCACHLPGGGSSPSPRRWLLVSGLVAVVVLRRRRRRWRPAARGRG